MLATLDFRQFISVSSLDSLTTRTEDKRASLALECQRQLRVNIRASTSQQIPRFLTMKLSLILQAVKQTSNTVGKMNFYCFCCCCLFVCLFSFLFFTCCLSIAKACIFSHVLNYIKENRCPRMAESFSKINSTFPKQFNCFSKHISCKKDSFK